MQIREVSLHRILVPLEEPTIWIGGADAAWSRTVLRMRTDEGFEGIAETSGDDATYAQLHALKPLFIGKSPFDRQPILATLWALPAGHGTSGKHAVQALETACWDIVGKALGQPLHRLLGGKLRSTVPMIAYVQPRCRRRCPGRHLVANPAKSWSMRPVLSSGTDSRPSRSKEAYFPHTRRWRRCVPYARPSPASPCASIRTRSGRSRRPFGSATSSRSCRSSGTRIRPGESRACDALAATSASRSRRTCAVCSLTSFLAQSVRTRSTSSCLTLTTGAASPARSKAAAACEVFQVGVGIHSTGETGIGTALNLHVAASLPTLPHAMDSYYHHQTVDVITEPLRYVDGAMAVPDGPGLGVEIDGDQLRHLEALHAAGPRPVVDPTGGPRYPGLY